MAEPRRESWWVAGPRDFSRRSPARKNSAPTGSVTLYEATAHPLAKVRVSGGGRCNVTHACFEPRELVKKYPRGGRELLGAFHRWQPRDTVEWFAARGVEMKTEDGWPDVSGDGRLGDDRRMPDAARRRTPA